MTATEAATATEPVHLVHRRTPADALQYDGTERMRGEIAHWVAAGGGSADLRFDGALLIRTPNKWVMVPISWWIVRGVAGQFFVIEPEVMVRCYDPADGPNYNAVLTRDQAAAIVVEIDEMLEAARGPQRTPVVLAQLERAAGWIHQLAATAEALR